MQGMALAAGQGPLHPNEVRNLLRDHRLGTPLAPGFTGIGSSMPDLRKIARARGWARALPVAAVPVAANAALLVYLDDEDHVVRRHYTSFTGWGSPLRVIDRGYLLPAQPTAVSTATPGRLLHQALASGPGGLHRAWWDSNLGEEPFTLIPASRDFAPGTTVAAVDAGATDLVLVGIDAKARLAMALPAGPAYPGSSFTIGGPALFRMTTGPVAVSVAAGHVEAFAVADHGTLVWCHGDAPFEDPWQPPVVEPTLTSFVPGARLAALSVDGQVLVAAVGVQGWLHAVQVDPSQGGGPTAFSTPVVIDTAAAIAAQGPLALARLTSTDSDLVLAFGVDTDGAVQVSDRPAAGGDWSPMRRIPSPVKASPLGGVVAITMPERGVMVFAVGVDGKVLSAQSLTPGHWDGFAPLPEGLSAPPIPPDPSPPPTPGSPLISAAFKGEPILEAIAANTDRISRTRNTPSSAVGKIQHALLVWDPGALPVHGEDQKYGDETAAAVRRFKEIALSVAPTQVIDDVGPATVLQLDKIQAASEGLLGKQTTLRFFTEYGEVAGGLAFSVTTAEAIKLLTTDAAGRASVHLTAPGRVELDTGSALNAVGNLLGRPWPPPAGFPDAPVLTPAANSSVMVQPGDVLDIVVATRVNLTAQLVSPLTGTLRVDGQGVAISETAGSVTLALQATGGRAATVLVDPLAPAMALPDLPPLVGWTPIGTYTVRPGDTEEGLAELFVGDPAGYAEISDHPPVPGEQLTLPVTPGWLRLATHSVSAPDPVPWFTVTPDRIVAAMLASGDPESVVDVTGVLDRPPAPGIDAGTDLSARAEALVVLLQGHQLVPTRKSRRARDHHSRLASRRPPTAPKRQLRVPRGRRACCDDRLARAGPSGRLRRRLVASPHSHVQGHRRDDHGRGAAHRTAVQTITARVGTTTVLRRGELHGAHRAEPEHDRRIAPAATRWRTELVGRDVARGRDGPDTRLRPADGPNGAARWRRSSRLDDADLCAHRRRAATAVDRRNAPRVPGCRRDRRSLLPGTQPEPRDTTAARRAVLGLGHYRETGRARRCDVRRRHARRRRKHPADPSPDGPLHARQFRPRQRVRGRPGRQRQARGVRDPSTGQQVPQCSRHRRPSRVAC